MNSGERRIDAALLALATLGSGAWSLSLGQDFNADQLHYHFYLGWSLAAGRLDRDIAPAGIGTYLARSFTCRPRPRGAPPSLRRSDCR